MSENESTSDQSKSVTTELTEAVMAARIEEFLNQC